MLCLPKFSGWEDGGKFNRARIFLLFFKDLNKESSQSRGDFEPIQFFSDVYFSLRYEIVLILYSYTALMFVLIRVEIPLIRLPQAYSSSYKLIC